MNTELITAILTSSSSLLVAVIAVVAGNRILGYKFDDLKKDFERLEEKVEKHNHLVERVAVVERDLKTAWTRIDESKADIKELRG